MEWKLSRRGLLQGAAVGLAAGGLGHAARAVGQQKGAVRVEGYAHQLSYVAGEEVQLHLSATEPAAVRWGVGRVGPRGWTPLETGREAVRLRPQAVPPDASAQGCRWPVALRCRVRAEWPSGYYLVRFYGADAAADAPPLGQVFFVVRPAQPGQRTKILLQLATNTYNAYTNWGGYSLYAYNGRHKVQGRRVSFDRPISSQFAIWEEPFIRWAEANGYTLDYCVNSDLEFHPELLSHYRLVLSVGHDEYWSAPMRDHLETYIARGGNVAFFSGNTCCWQVRSEDHGRALVCWKQSFGDDPHYKQGKFATLTTLWSHYLVNRPENRLTGVGFLWGGYHRSHGQLMDGSGAFTVHRPEHWLFAGTHLRRGDSFGAKLPHYKVVGYECDGCELEWKEGLPYPTHRDGTPEGFVVLATAPARWHPDDCEWYEKWQKGRQGYAVVGTYTRGGTVVTVGTTDWSHGLRGQDPAVVQITRNILDRLGQAQ